MTGELPAQRASNAENVFIWWRNVQKLQGFWNFPRLKCQWSKLRTFSANKDYMGILYFLKCLYRLVIQKLSNVRITGPLRGRTTDPREQRTSNSQSDWISWPPMSSTRWGHDDVIKWKHFRVTDLLCGEFPAQRPVTRSFDVFFDLRLNQQLSKQSRGWWFETSSPPLWRHCNVNTMRYHCQIRN